MSAGLGVSESATGQLVTVYAIGTVAAAIPLSAATSTWPRKRLLPAGVAGFAVGNTATAVATAFPVALAARFVAHIDRWLRALMIAAAVLFAVAVTALAADLAVTPLVYVAVTLWGLGFGGVPTLSTTAAGDAGGEAADAAQALLVTLWNAAMAGGGVAGGLLLDRFGAGSLPWSALVLLVPALAVVVAARAHGFPAARR